MDRPRAGLVSLEFLLYGSPHAEVAELADALASGASPGNRVEVRVLSSAQPPATQFLSVEWLTIFRPRRSPVHAEARTVFGDFKESPNARVGSRLRACFTCWSR